MTEDEIEQFATDTTAIVECLGYVARNIASGQGAIGLYFRPGLRNRLLRVFAPPTGWCTISGAARMMILTKLFEDIHEPALCEFARCQTGVLSGTRGLIPMNTFNERNLMATHMAARRTRWL